MTALNALINSGDYFPNSDAGIAATKLFYNSLSSIKEARDGLGVAIEVARSNYGASQAEPPLEAA